jgi:hypothetical protein
VPATEAGHYPTLAYQLAFAVMIGLQLSAWAWLLVKPRASIAPAGMPLTRQP